METKAAEVQLDKAKTCTDNAKAWLNDHERSRKRGGSDEDDHPAAAKQPRVEFSQTDHLHSMWRALKDDATVLKKGRVRIPRFGTQEEDEEEEEERFEYAYLELPEGTQFCTSRGRFGQRLLVRECYPRIFDQWWSRVKEGERGANASGEILIGSSGIGKSRYRLAQAGEHTVVFQATDGEMTATWRRWTRLQRSGRYMTAGRCTWWTAPGRATCTAACAPTSWRRRPTFRFTSGP